MELKKGMYIRIKDKNNNQFIRKIIELPEDIRYGSIVVDKDIHYARWVSKKNIVKASDNLIDLIEVGDLIETPKGIFQVGYIENNVIYTDNSKVIACLREDKHLCFENTTIVSIVTKEQFENQKYIMESSD